MIISSKQKYYKKLGSKLNNPLTYFKTSWPLLKTLVSDRRVSIIPPIQVGDKFITNCTEKAKVFNYYFVRQCRVIDNNSQLPDRANFSINEILSNIKFANVDILRILKYLDINKAHGHDNLSFYDKLRDDLICKPLKLT